MIKVMFLVKKKSDITFEEFVKHYDEIHVPLAMRHLPHIKKHVRNYIRVDADNGTVILPRANGMDFDCISEVYFDSMEGWQATGHSNKTTNVGEILGKDQATFVDDHGIQGNFMVEEHVTLSKSR